MKPIDTKNRLVANINTGKFVPFLGSDGTMDGEVLQVNGREKWIWISYLPYASRSTFNPSQTHWRRGISIDRGRLEGS